MIDFDLIHQSLLERTSFILRYHAKGVAPFRDIQQKINTEEDPYSPYEDPSFDPEDGEPAFLTEWCEAHECAQIVGWSAVSLLSDSLKLYFNELGNFLGYSPVENGNWLQSAKEKIGEALEIDWGDCTVSFGVIEQVVLTRNQIQHGDDLVEIFPRHRSDTLTKYSSPFFANDVECEILSKSDADLDNIWFGPLLPKIEVTEQKIDDAIQEVEALAILIEKQTKTIKGSRVRERRG